MAVRRNSIPRPSVTDQNTVTGFTQISNAVLFGMPWLSDAAQRVYALVVGLHWGDSGNGIWHAQDKLTAIWDRPKRTFRDALIELEFFGLIERIDRRPATTLIRLLDLPEVAHLYARYKWALLRGKIEWPTVAEATPEELCRVAFARTLTRAQRTQWESFLRKRDKPANLSETGD